MIKKLNVHKGYIARIKHKCLICIISLMELRETDISIMNRMRRSMPLNVLAERMTDIY